MLSQIFATIFVLSARTSNWLLVRKYSRDSKDPLSFNAVINALSALFAGLAIFLVGVDTFYPSPKVIGLVLAAAGVMFLANILRVFSLKHIDVSVVSTLGQLSLLVSTFLSFILGMAHYNHLLGLGILAVFGGNVLLFFDPKAKNKWVWNKYLALSVIGAICLGLGSVIYNSVKADIPLLLYILVSLTTQFLLNLLIPKVTAKSVSHEIRTLGWRSLVVGLFWFLSGTSVVVAIKTMGIVLGVIVGNFALVTITLFSFIVLKEYSRAWQKLVATLIVFGGTLLVVLNP